MEIILNITCQSFNIAQKVDTGGAGEQVIMYGYKTDEYLPKGLKTLDKR
ncbi:hypothetical protein K0B03_01775 [Patescibacteria group bacterium]|nr:hypothetical protein [Patescibacteria group bacterium]